MLRLNNISLSFGEKVILDHFSLDLPEGAVSVLLGPSGCGKTTLCNIIAGTQKPQTGEIEGAQKGKVAYLFQEPRLLPWYSVRKNLELVIKKMFSREECKLAIDSILDTVDLTDYADFYPGQLSGGMARRASLARAFVYPSELTLMDEPFQAIDLKRKLELTNYVNKVWETGKKTSLFVTHDITEALLLGDYIRVLSGPPMEIKASFINNVPRNRRNLNNENILLLEKDIYKIVTG